MKITVTIDEATIKRLIADYVRDMLGKAVVVAADVRLLVKSKQNYKATWEPCGLLVTNDEESLAFKDAGPVETEIKAEVESA